MSFELTLGLAENAADNGVEFKFNSGVKAIEKLTLATSLLRKREEIATKSIINCAGVYADEIHNMVCEDKITIKPEGRIYTLR